MTGHPEEHTNNAPLTHGEDDSVGTPTDVFLSYRELLFSITYNLLGSVADTEDVLQETWVSWVRNRERAQGREIEKPRAYLVRIAVNHALARQTTISKRRESYVGEWLPEPLITDSTGKREAADAAETALRTESVSMAMLVILQTLTPLERAVFVLHEVFGYAHTEIADILERSPSAVRQLAHRAREHVHARRPRFEADPRVQKQATERFLAAALGGDVSQLMQMLAPDVTMWSDGGGKVRSGQLRPVQGREKVARLLVGYAARTTEELDIRYRHVNGDASAVVFAEGSPYAVMVMDMTPEGDQVQGIYTVLNPDKLSHLRMDERDGDSGDGTEPVAEAGAEQDGAAS
ncbi:RNA polymerase sigma factor SigJ [Streptomyces sp. T-3]|nr:RNA polymerase sigma factor SigJ [Streptomyces sp. T-3]